MQNKFLMDRLGELRRSGAGRGKTRQGLLQAERTSKMERQPRQKTVTAHTAKKIRQMRVNCTPWTQEDCANKLGMSLAQYQQIEAGYVVIPEKTAFALARMFGTTWLHLSAKPVRKGALGRFLRGLWANTLNGVGR